MAEKSASRMRVDKWLWQARFFKTRAKTSELAASGRLRINSERCQRASQAVKPGDTLTFPQGRVIRVIRIEAIGERRGPAREAATLYSDLSPAPDQEATEDTAGLSLSAPITRASGSGRPTKRERRETDALRRTDT
jgi:ribosome-associated heat shock protein Hsp15